MDWDQDPLHIIQVAETEVTVITVYTMVTNTYLNNTLCCIFPPIYAAFTLYTNTQIVFDYYRHYLLFFMVYFIITELKFDFKNNLQNSRSCQRMTVSS